MDGSISSDEWIRSASGGLEPLQTPRLNLRALRMDDAEFIATHAPKPEVARMTVMIPAVYPGLAAEGFILIMNASERSRGDRVRMVTSRAGSRLGLVGLHPRNDKTWEFGYWYTKSASGVGYATEAGQAMLDEAKRDQIGPVVSGYFKDNPLSGRVLKKLGFVETGEREMAWSLGRLENACCIRMALET